MKKISKYILVFLLGVAVSVFLPNNNNLETTEKLKYKIASQDSAIARKNIAIDSLKKRRNIVIVSRDGTRVDINNRINYIDSLTTPVITDSMVSKALLWAKQQDTLQQY